MLSTKWREETHELCRMPVDHVCWSGCAPAIDEHRHPPEDLPQSCDMPDMLSRVEHRLNIAAHNSPFKSYEAEHYRAAWEWLMIRISYVPGSERNRHYEYYLPWVPEKAR